MALLGYRLLLGLACILGCWIAYRAWTNRETAGTRPLAGFALSSAIWSGGSLGLTLASTPAVEFRWVQFMYVGVVGAPISFIALAYEYTDSRQYLTSTVKRILIAGGGVFLGLVWTNPYHEWYWTEIDYTAAAPAGASFSPAPGFWTFVACTYLLLFGGAVFLVRYALTAPHLYRSQTIAILVGVGAPWAASIPYSFQWMDADYTPVALAVTTGALWTAMFQYRLTDLGPVALRTVFESISTGVLVLDHHDRLVDVNTAGQSLLDISNDAIGTPFRALAPTEAFAKHVQTASDQPEVLVLDEDHRSDPDGTAPQYYEVRVTSINTSHRRQAGRIVVVNDVTDQYERQRELERQNERLEKFTSVVSHDLRNPLNVATGNVTLAQETDNEEHLDRAERALNRMTALIDDLLALAHGGGDIAETEPVNLKAVTKDAWQTVDTQKATLRLQTDHTILADRSRLHQLIENLLRNAIEQGGERVTVTIGNRSRGFYVADDGPGIPPDAREKAFETGYSTRENGTGFGLNIVREIAEAHGWEVRITDSADGGAQFNFTGVTVADAASPPEDK